MKKISMFIVLFFCLQSSLSAQEKRIELSIAVRGEGINTDRSSGTYTIVSGQALYKINRHISGGLSYSGTILSYSDVGIYSGFIGNSDLYSETAKYQSYGLIIKAGSNREKRVSIYGFAGIFRAAMADEFSLDGFSNGKFTVSTSGIGYQGGLGVMVKVSRSISLKLVEAGVTYYNSSLNYVGDEPMFGAFAEAGVIFMLLRKK